MGFDLFSASGRTGWERRFAPRTVLAAILLAGAGIGLPAGDIAYDSPTISGRYSATTIEELYAAVDTEDGEYVWALGSWVERGRTEATIRGLNGKFERLWEYRVNMPGDHRFIDVREETGGFVAVGQYTNSGEGFILRRVDRGGREIPSGDVGAGLGGWLTCVRPVEGGRVLAGVAREPSAPSRMLGVYLGWQRDDPPGLEERVVPGPDDLYGASLDASARTVCAWTGSGGNETAVYVFEAARTAPLDEPTFVLDESHRVGSIRLSDDGEMLLFAGAALCGGRYEPLVLATDLAGKPFWRRTLPGAAQLARGECLRESSRSGFLVAGHSMVEGGRNGPDFVLLSPALPRPAFIRGDSNLDGRVDIADACHVLLIVLHSRHNCLDADASDADDDGRITVTDAICVIDHLFRGGPPMPPPFPGSGGDPTPDSLWCDSM